MKTVRNALLLLLTIFVLSAVTFAGEELEFTWSEIEDEYDDIANTFVVNGFVNTPAAGETTVGENIIMLTRPGTQHQTYKLSSIFAFGEFQIESPQDPANGDPLPATYVLLAYDSADNYDGYGGTAE